MGKNGSKFSGKQKALMNKNKTIPSKKAETKVVEIKPKKKSLGKTGKTVVAVCAVIAVAVAAFILWRTDTFLRWFPGSDKVSIEDYSIIEVSDELSPENTETDIQSHLDTLTHNYAEEVEDENAVIGIGDIADISYVGTIDGEEFEGGSSDHFDLEIGSGTFIDGFEDGLIGMKAGESTTLHLKFPEDYSETNEDLNGADVDFEVTIQHIERIPELTDAFIQEHAEELVNSETLEEGEVIDTIEKYKEWYLKHGNDTALYSAISDALMEKTTIISKNNLKYQEFGDYVESWFVSMANMNGLDADTLASYYGYESASDYIKDETKNTYKRILMMRQIAADLGISHTEDEILEKTQEMINESPDSYVDADGNTLTAQQYLEYYPLQAEIYTAIDMDYYQIMNILRDRVSYVHIEEEIESYIEEDEEEIYYDEEYDDEVEQNR